MLFGTGNLSGLGQFGPIVDPETGARAGSVGAFLQALLHFFIVAFVMFLVVKGYNAFKERTSEPAPEDVAEAEDITLLRQIRDALTTRTD